MKSRLWRGAARAGLVGTALGVAISVFSAQSAFALGTLGTATPVNPNTLAPLSGTQGSTQQFGEQLSATSGQPAAYCTSSTSTNSTEEDSYFVPSTVDPSTLSFVGGVPQGTGNFSLYTASPIAQIKNINTATSGQVVAIPTNIVFGGIFPASAVLPGGVTTMSWNGGIACAAPPAAGGASTVTDEWNCVFTFTAVATSVDANGYQWTYNCGGGANVPESPLAVGLPIGGAAVIGGALFYTWRRKGGAGVAAAA